MSKYTDKAIEAIVKRIIEGMDLDDLIQCVYTDMTYYYSGVEDDELEEVFDTYGLDILEYRKEQS